jgi:hypothetical protein
MAGGTAKPTTASAALLHVWRDTPDTIFAKQTPSERIRRAMQKMQRGAYMARSQCIENQRITRPRWCWRVIRTRVASRANRGALRSDSVPERTTRDRKSGAIPGAATINESTQ